MQPPSTPKVPKEAIHGNHPETPIPPDGDPMLPENFINSSIRRQAGVFTKKIGNNYILYDPLEQTYLRLNESANNLWNAVGDNERISVSEVISKSINSQEEVLDGLITFAELSFIMIVTTQNGD